MISIRLAAAACVLTAVNALAQNRLPANRRRPSRCGPTAFTGGSGREDSMWSALYAAKSGKLYIGLCTHAEAAHFYEFDPATQTMHHVADLTEFKGERGTGHPHHRQDPRPHGRGCGRAASTSATSARTPARSASTRPATAGRTGSATTRNSSELENLGQINRQWGLLGFVLEPKYQRLYGLAEDGHLYTFDLRRKTTTDLGRVDDWDICRTIFCRRRGQRLRLVPHRPHLEIRPEAGPALRPASRRGCRWIRAPRRARCPTR